MSRISIVFSSAVLFICVSLFSQTPVEQYGQLSVEGNKIVDAEGNPVQLRGMSLFWSQWGPSFFTRNTVGWLAEDWKISVIRAVLGVDTITGYMSAPIYARTNKARIDSVVTSAIDNGIYVIVDWHEENAYKHTDSAKAFFRDMATKYGEYPNIIYEIFNEPTKVSWTNVIKPYADTIISAIREIDRDNIIIVGTPQWCLQVDSASVNPFTEYDNVSYTLHFYAATHKQFYRNKATTALNNGVSLFVTEWGTCASSGSGMIDLTETRTWLKYMDSTKLSWCNWSVNNKAETASILKTSTTTVSDWAIEDLSPSGVLLRSILRSYAGAEDLDSSIFVRVIDTISVPGKVEAELFRGSGGAIGTEETSDVGKGEVLTYIDNNDWVDYILNVTDTGAYNIDIRVASANEGGTIILAFDNKSFDTVTVPKTGGWYTWDIVHSSIVFPSKGLHALKLTFKGTGGSLFNINYLDINESAPVIVPLRGKTANLRISQLKQSLRIDMTGNPEITTGEIYSTDGRRIKCFSLPQGNSRVQTGKLKNGSYVIKLSGESVISRPFVIIR